MALNLSTTSSIVDYLALQGKDSSFTARKRLYDELGLSDRLGEYTGSPTQNVNFLNTLRTQTTPPAPTTSPYGMSTPTGSVNYNLGPTSSPNSPAPQSPTPSPYGMSTASGPVYYNNFQPPQTPAPAPAPTQKPAATPAPAPAKPAASPQPAPENPVQPQQSFGAADALGAIGFAANNIPTADEAIKKVLESPAYQNYLDSIGLKNKMAAGKAETDKIKLEQDAAAKAKQINDTYGSRGLFFSGMRPEDLQTLAQNLASSKLGVDRELAGQLLENDLSLKDRLYNDVEKLIESAVSNSGKAQDRALDQLNAAGYALIGGQLIPTLEYRRLVNEKSEYRNVDGVGLVKITGDQYEVVVPEVAKPESLTYKQKVDLEVKLANDFEKYAKTSRDAARSIQIIETGYREAVQAGLDGRSLNAASQPIIVTFQKMLDPTSVVRESEYARSGAGQSLMNRIQGTVDKLRYGGAGVSQAELKEFYDVSQQLLKGYQAEQLNFARRTQTQADSYNLDLQNILTPDVLGLLNNTTGLTSGSSDEEIDAWLNNF